jgi:ABC-type anion transport system duplicated permease subunit
MTELSLSKAKEYATSSYQRIAVVAGLSLVAGVGIGLAVESHTNEVAAGKAITATTCLELYDHENVVTEEMDDCFDAGVPGGEPIGKDKLAAEIPIAYVESYIAAQENEAESIEIGRLAVWSIVPIASTAGYVIFLS